MTDFPTATIGSVDLHLTANPDEINAYLGVVKAVAYDEWNDKSYPIPAIEDFKHKKVMVGKIDGKVIGGLAIHPPSSDPLELLKQYSPAMLVPDWRTLRRYGRIAEVSKLFAHPSVRGKIDMIKFWEYVNEVLKAMGSEYVMIGANVKNNVFILYSTFGFKPLTIPMDSLDGEGKPYPKESMITPAFLMMKKLYDHLPMHPCVYDVDQTRILAFSKYRFEKR